MARQLNFGAMSLDLTFFLVAIPAVIFAGVSKGGFGSGAAFAAAPILALVIDPALALGVMLPLLMVIDATSLRAFWGKWDRADTIRLIVGGLPGVALGAALWRVADADLLRLLIGSVALGFVAFQLARRWGWLAPRSRPFSPWVGYLTGMVGGFTSFVSHAGGPPVAVYLLSQGHSKSTYQATTVATFAAVNVFKLVPYIGLGIFTQATLIADLILAPVAVAGALLGVVAHKWISEDAFFALTYVLLVGAGTRLIWVALS